VWPVSAPYRPAPRPARMRKCLEQWAQHDGAGARWVDRPATKEQRRLDGWLYDLAVSGWGRCECTPRCQDGCTTGVTHHGDHGDRANKDSTTGCGAHDVVESRQRENTSTRECSALSRTKPLLAASGNAEWKS
jgi:hypothetical protein